MSTAGRAEAVSVISVPSGAGRSVSQDEGGNVV